MVRTSNCAGGSALWKRVEISSSILTTLVGASLPVALICLNLSEFLACTSRDHLHLQQLVASPGPVSAQSHV